METWPQSLKVTIDLVLDSPLAMIVLWGPELVQIYNDAYSEVMAAKHPKGLGQRTRDCWPEVWDFNATLFAAVWKGEARTFTGQSLRIERHGRPEDAMFDLTYSPLRDESNSVAGILVTVVETTARHKAEAALREGMDEKLRISEARLRALAEASSDALYRMNPDWTEMRELAGGGFVADTARPSRDWLMAYIPVVDQAYVTAAIDTAIRSKSVFQLEHRVRRVDGSIGWTLSHAVPILGPDGEIVEWFGAASDVTERRETEERQVLLAREVDHRARNALAVVQALVRLTRTEEPAAFRKAVEGRIAALSRAHSLLSESRWTGGDLLALVKAELAPFLTTAEPKITLSGPTVSLSPDAVQPTAMLLHELSTNAVKHGALSVAAGQVSVSWVFGPDERLTLTWLESGGPPVAAAPTRSGFGTQVMQASASQLDGDVAQTWLPGGVRCDISLSFRIAKPGSGAPVQPEDPASSGEVSGRPGCRRVLIVEDEVLLAMSIQQHLESAGYQVVGPAHTLGEALRLAIDEPHLDAAILDINLRGKEVWPAAEALGRRRVPHLFTTGYSRGESSSSEIARSYAETWPMLQKPVTMERLSAALQDLLVQGRAAE